MDPMQESGENELTSITLFAGETAVATSTTIDGMGDNDAGDTDVDGGGTCK